MNWVFHFEHDYEWTVTWSGVLTNSQPLRISRVANGPHELESLPCGVPHCHSHSDSMLSEFHHVDCQAAVLDNPALDHHTCPNMTEKQLRKSTCSRSVYSFSSGQSPMSKIHITSDGNIGPSDRTIIFRHTDCSVNWSYPFPHCDHRSYSHYYCWTDIHPCWSLCYVPLMSLWLVI